MNIQYTFATVSSIVIIVIPLQTTITAIIIIRKFFLFFTATTTNNRHFIIACHFFSQVLERFLQFSSYTWSTISHNILNNTENEATHCSSIETVFLSLPNRLRFDKNLTSGDIIIHSVHFLRSIILSKLIIADILNTISRRSETSAGRAQIRDHKRTS